jgi:hypothetical protein
MPMRIRSHSMLSVACASLLCAPAMSAQEPAVDTVAVRNVAPGPRTLVIVRAADASIHVVGAAESAVAARMRRTSGDNRAEPGTLRADHNADTVLVTVARPQRAPFVLDVSVPRGVALRIEGANGGPVSVERVGGPVELTHSNGKVTLANVVGYALVATSNGGITAQLDSLDRNAASSFITSNGNVVLTMPANVRATLTIDAQLPIESDFPLRAEMGGPAPRVGARVITEHIREGGSAIRISTDNGVVRLEVRR